MKKYLIAILSIIFIFQIKSNVFGASYEELYLQAGQDTTVTVPYYGDSYSWDGTGESVIYASSDSSVAVAYNVGVSMGSYGSWISVKIQGKKEGNANILMYMAESGELLAAYSVHVTEPDAVTLSVCKNQHTNIDFSYATENYYYIDSSSSMHIYSSSTSQSGINEHYSSYTQMTVSFGNIGEHTLKIFDDNGNQIATYKVIVSDHQWDDGVIVKKATSTEEGEKKYSCSRCGATESKMIPKLVGGWKKNDRGTWYEYSDGSYLSNCWSFLDGSWYHFTKKGYRDTGWLKIKNSWYFMNETTGKMETGWKYIQKQWYYFQTDGVMKTGWEKINEKWYYLNENGEMQTGWQKISRKWYYMDKSGVMQTGWKKISGKWYYMDQNGAMQTSKWISGTYYVKADGSMAVSEWVDGGKYYVDAEGKWVKDQIKTA